ncbi:hypothetical protein BU23DRAFT_118775 [Bimuria novae-zelandiae CBS 107.79]|uniref:Uncharacterized protein n=1 Tax=Bimuria novae-zelandiae CBS 107.79 TaxID=1447943 RepID=A0A6A5VBU8_9PLEO|nr:hypothetical protein BU23DRAFT_118775 [Bimuria novae-zelandiae CBS 107.79]
MYSSRSVVETAEPCARIALTPTNADPVARLRSDSCFLIQTHNLASEYERPIPAQASRSLLLGLSFSRRLQCASCVPRPCSVRRNCRIRETTVLTQLLVDATNQADGLAFAGMHSYAVKNYPRCRCSCCCNTAGLQISPHRLPWIWYLSARCEGSARLQTSQHVATAGSFKPRE